MNRFDNVFGKSGVFAVRPPINHKHKARQPSVNGMASNVNVIVNA